jgi:hypothetical protein
MIRKLTALVWALALLLPMSIDAESATAASARHVQALFFDAIFTSARTGGPGPSHVGHRQIASGILRDASGRRQGNFSFTCTWTSVEPAGAPSGAALRSSRPTADSTRPERLTRTA